MRGKRMTVLTCEVVDCHRKPFANDLCTMHNMRQWRHGDVYYRRPSVLLDFWSQVHKDTVGGCWQWLGNIDKDGYGHITYRQAGRTKNERVHRHTYELLIGPIPKGLTIDHLCRNRSCVNPVHMEPVSNAVNLQRGHAIRGHRINH